VLVLLDFFFLYYIQKFVFTNTYIFQKRISRRFVVQRSVDGAKVDLLDEDNAFAVFISYTEIYNNYVFDLLENINETGIISK